MRIEEEERSSEYYTLLSNSQVGEVGGGGRERGRTGKVGCHGGVCCWGNSRKYRAEIVELREGEGGRRRKGTSGPLLWVCTCTYVYLESNGNSTVEEKQKDECHHCQLGGDGREGWSQLSNHDRTGLTLTDSFLRGLQRALTSTVPVSTQSGVRVAGERRCLPERRTATASNTQRSILMFISHSS